ncbi:glycoside hydrolase family 172 protein [Kutzneria sp. 744]|uniref:glycoside hydrolase family 172 protein n=1 Tax=Kutzneria sp. (strain 744) TaxID=345341 RepID=UPI0003EED0C5|nr:glycoside hydrolase family 172 protein [Kutzneria sp. 744]EWM18497.1 hypothetical protein KUTG_08801 [Kutzneria sp. 744]
MIGRVLCALGLAAMLTSPVSARPMSIVDNGPVGWDVYRHMDALGLPQDGARSRQFSSFDRTGGNEDGFNGTYSCLRTTADGCVIAERSGAGELSSIWFTRDYGVVAKTGRIKVELDGKIVLNAPLQDVVDGKLGAPFVWPLVGNGDDTAGGSVIKVPMPYRQSMRVTTEQNPLFYHVDYRTFADPAGVSTFDPGDRAQDVIDKLRAFGLRDPKGSAAGASTVPASADALPGGTTTLAQLAGPGRITQLRLRLPQLVRSPRVNDDGRAFGAGGHSAFTVAIDPANSGVRLTRRYDPGIGSQRANLVVDGQSVGQWSNGAAVPGGMWAEQAIELPAALTAGKSLLHVENDFVSSSVDVNEFRYDVHSEVGADWNRTDVVDLGPGHPGEEQAHGYQITAPTWQGSRVFRYDVPAGQVDATNSVLSNARLRIAFDGRTTVDAPLGEFFGSGLGEFDTRTLMSSIDATPGGWLTAWWPMPFSSTATVQLVNGSGAAIAGATAEITSAPGGSAQDPFHATHIASTTVNGKDFPFMDVRGHGVFYGATHTMRGLIPTGNQRAYLEGDERAYVDGSASPAWHGTGTEDFYESGWYFRDGTTYAMPLVGNPAYQTAGDGCQYDCTGAYRLLLPDSVPFDTGLRFGIEHGPANDAAAAYSSTAYWYGDGNATAAQSDVVDPADAGSRAAHGYQAGGETRASLTSTFEGSAQPVTGTVTAATGPISFTAHVSGAFRLVRTGDQASGYQSATVFVNGRLIGAWVEPLANKSSRWLTDSFEVPGSYPSTVTIRLEPTAGAWSASKYQVVTAPIG